MIDTLITAVRSGELDRQFAEASEQANPRKSERAAGQTFTGSGIFVLLPDLPYATSSGDKKTRRLPCHHSMSWQK